MTGTLKKINGKDIAKIASGQVIVDLKSVIKELIENALVFIFGMHYEVGCKGYQH